MPTEVDPLPTDKDAHVERDADAEVRFSPPELVPPEETVTRNLVVLLLDTSSSMAWLSSSPVVTAPKGQAPINDLNRALADFLSDGMHQVPPLEFNGELAIGQFSGSAVRWIELPADTLSQAPFSYVRRVRSAPTLTAGGTTPMGAAIISALDMVRQRKKGLREDGLTHEFRPNIFLLTDGNPTDDMTEAIKRLRAAEAAHEVLFFALGTGQANNEVLRNIAMPEAYYPIHNRPIHTYIQFLSKSLQHQSGAGDVDAETMYEHIRRNLTQNEAADQWLT